MATALLSIIQHNISILPLLALITPKIAYSTYMPSDMTNVPSTVPIYYYGFLNNAFYNMHKITSSGNIKLECPQNLIVNITNASYGDPPINVTSSIKCNKRLCVINSGDYVRKPFKHLTVEFECVAMESVRTLFDGNKFHPGITRNYLILERDFDGQSPDYSVINSINFLLKYRKYPYLVWNGKDWVGENGNWHDEKATTLVNYEQLTFSGYSVFLNYVAICNNVTNCYEMDDIYAAYSECETSDCSFFTISFENQLSISTKRTWLCRGWPTIVPLKGHLAAVKCSAFDSNNINTHIANNNTFM